MRVHVVLGRTPAVAVDPPPTCPNGLNDSGVSGNAFKRMVLGGAPAWELLVLAAASLVVARMRTIDRLACCTHDWGNRLLARLTLCIFQKAARML